MGLQELFLARLNLYERALQVLLQPYFLQGPRHNAIHEVNVERLREVIIGSFAQSFDRRLSRNVTGNGHHYRFRAMDPQVIHDLESIRARHDEIGDHEIERLLLYLLHPLHTIHCCRHLVSCTLQQDLQVLSQLRLILNEENGRVVFHYFALHHASTLASSPETCFPCPLHFQRQYAHWHLRRAHTRWLIPVPCLPDALSW